MYQPYHQRDPSPSKIPRALGKDFSNYKPSKLDLMKADYRRKIMKETEQKILDINENNQRKTQDRLSRINHQNSPQKQASSVRNFFQEARALEANGNRTALAQHYSRRHRSAYQPSKDRNNRLVPLMNTNKGDYENKGYHDYDDEDEDENPLDEMMDNRNKYAKSYSAPPTIKYKTKPGINIDESIMNLNQNTMSNTSSPDQLHKSPQHRAVMNKRKPLPEIPKESQEKLTDFQKWQLEQIRDRQERLQRYQQKNKPTQSEKYDSDEGIDSDRENQNVIEEEILKKQQELIMKIEQQQRELDAIRVEKEKQQIEPTEKKVLTREKPRIVQNKSFKKGKAVERNVENEVQNNQRDYEQDNKIHSHYPAQDEERHSVSRSTKYSEEDHLTYRKAAQVQESEPITQSKKVIQQKKKTPPKSYPPQQPKKQASYPPENDAEEIYNADNANVDFYIQAAQQSEMGADNVQLVACRVCGRRFAADRVPKHEMACKKSQKKRKVFDPVKMRTEGTESAKFIATTDPPKPKPKKKDWRKQHEEFINSIRYAKKIKDIESKGGDIKQITPPPPAENPDYVPCPHCSRTFNSSAAERHIPRCRDLMEKQKFQKKRNR